MDDRPAALSVLAPQSLRIGQENAKLPRFLEYDAGAEGCVIQIDCHNPAYLPPDEEQRQRAVDRSGALSRMGDPALQDLVERAADLFRVPMAALTIIDHDRQWLVARVGLEADQTDRALSFCTHTILEPGRTLVVTDARRDRRFANNPTVLFAPHIRFYAGVPILDRSGFALGSLCIVDAKPRPVPENVLQLALLAREAEHIIGRNRY